ncbi:MAG: PDZ domain-containing protein [Propionibacteriaceae bacterium]|nr:PDZ domain-containing protein [Propionibacteriaceae bacterium]
MTKQTWTAAVSALIFVVAAAVVAMTPVPFVAFGPGNTYDLLAETDGMAAVQVDGLETFPSPGRILVTSVSASQPDAPVSLPESVIAHAATERQVYPREYVYPARATVAEIRTRESQQMATSQTDAAAAALRAAGIEVERIPMIQSVASTGPAEGRLFPGDFVLAIDDTPTTTADQVRQAIENRPIGQKVLFTVLRDRERLVVNVDTTNSKTNASLPVWGGQVGMGYSYAPQVHLTLPPELGGTSAGLMLALGIYDRITPDNLAGGRTVAGTGAIDGAGVVTGVRGVREKLIAAERARADVFFVPDANCSDLAETTSSVRVVSVASLEDAINSLDLLADPSTEGLVKGCS